jgi:hypothetical protein
MWLLFVLLQSAQHGTQLSMLYPPFASFLSRLYAKDLRLPILSLKCLSLVTTPINLIHVGQTLVS